MVEKALKADGSGKVALGYNDDEIKWCKKKGPEVWEIMNSRRYMESMDPMMIRGFTMTDPNHFLEEKNIPSGIATWMGMQIVDRYMSQHKKVTVEQLLKSTDYQRILADTNF